MTAINVLALINIVPDKRQFKFYHNKSELLVEIPFHWILFFFLKWAFGKINLKILFWGGNIRF